MLVPFGGLLREAPDIALRAILLLQVALVVVAALLLGRTRSGAGVRVGLVFATCSVVFSFTKVFVNGLESALELVLLAWAIESAERALREGESRVRDRNILVTAALCGVLTLARLSAIFGAILLVGMVLRRARPAKRISALAACATLVPVCAYAAFLNARFGHATPVSAAIKYGRGYTFWSFSIVPVTIACLAVGYAVRREVRSPSWPIWALPLTSWVGIQLACDAVFRRMIIPEIWYLVPHATLFVLAACEGIARAPRLRFASAGVLLLGAVVWLVRVRPVTYSSYVESRDVGGWLASNTPPNARIAGWDCGIAAFYSNRAFMNLDGLASSWEYKTEFLDRGRIRAFLDLRGVDYVAQYVPEDTPLAQFHGVDLADWDVVLDRPFAFRGIAGTIGRPTVHSRYIVLKRRAPDR